MRFATLVPMYSVVLRSGETFRSNGSWSCSDLRDYSPFRLLPNAEIIQRFGELNHDTLETIHMGQT